jgi:uncharacterized protein YjiS (DUF1127 family)
MKRKEHAVSTIHAYAENCTRIETLPMHRLADALAAMRAGAARLVTRWQDRRTLQRLERVSDHDLADMGFERDWDGSVSRARH